MIVTVEVPEGHKWCNLCGGVYPKESHFQIKRSTNPNTGTVSTYFDRRCKQCFNDRQKAVRSKELTHRAPARMPAVRRYITPRHPMEALCDTAFMGWRCATPGLTGARL